MTTPPTPVNKLLRLELVEGNGFDSYNTSYRLVRGNDGRLVLAAFHRETDQPKASELVGTPVQSIRLRQGAPADVLFQDYLAHGALRGESSPVVRIVGNQMGTSRLTLDVSDWDELSEKDQILILNAYQMDRFVGYFIFRDEASLFEAASRGYIVPFENHPDLGFVADPGMRYKYTTHVMMNLLLEIAQRWLAAVAEAEIFTAGSLGSTVRNLIGAISRTSLRQMRNTLRGDYDVLRVTSALRPLTYQRELVRDNHYPVAEKSAHCIGMAVDIDRKILGTGAPSRERLLEELLRQMEAEQRILLLDEHDIGCWHITPRFDVRPPAGGSGIVR